MLLFGMASCNMFQNGCGENTFYWNSAIKTHARTTNSLQDAQNAPHTRHPIVVDWLKSFRNSDTTGHGCRYTGYCTSLLSTSRTRNKYNTFTFLTRYNYYYCDRGGLIKISNATPLQLHGDPTLIRNFGKNPTYLVIHINILLLPNRLDWCRKQYSYGQI